MSAYKLKPVFKNYIWGGRVLNDLYSVEGENIAEAWVLSTHPDGESVTDDGRRLSDITELPVLIKLICSAQNLSVQIHPDDEYARRVENSRGKTEMWKVLGCERGARVYIGFKRAYSRERIAKEAQNGTLLRLLKSRRVRVGDEFFIGANTVHALGAGVTLCEIQQSSNLTYRLCDYGRGRELHLEKALACCERPRVRRRDYHGFSCEDVRVRGEYSRQNGDEDSTALVFVEGAGELEHEGKMLCARAGDCLLVDGGDFAIKGDCRAIIVKIASEIYAL